MRHAEHSTHIRRRSRTRRGLSLLECMLAVGMLGLSASMIAGALSYAYRAQNRELGTLGAAELASTLILQYLDERESMPSAGLPIAYGPEGNEVFYRWDLSDKPARLENNPRAEAQAETNATGASMADRFRQITIRVWRSEESEGSFTYTGGSGTAVITRLYHPLAFEYRSPDTLQKMVESEEGVRRLMEQIMGAGDQPIEIGTTQASSESNSGGGR